MQSIKNRGKITPCHKFKLKISKILKEKSKKKSDYLTNRSYRYTNRKNVY